MMRALLPVLAISALAVAPVSAQKIQSELFASGFSRPVALTAPDGDQERVFVCEQYTGRIEIVKNGTVLSTAFLDLSSLSQGSEQGLLGLAFHPDYDQNGYFFVNYTNSSGNTRVVRYKVSSTNPDVADSGSATTILSVSQPFSNHNGGNLAFGPDGYLYIGLGDGGSGGDPYGNGQKGTTMLGKILRIDIDSGNPYAIPPTNPFVGNSSFLDEIWAYGMRNPWRFSFDRLTGDLWIGDVGQNAWEEIDFQPASSAGGENYGWRCREGNHNYNTSGCSGPYTDPLYEYRQSSSSGNPWGYCVTGGFCYGGSDLLGIQGTYFFADYSRNWIWSFRRDASGAVAELQNRSTELDPPGSASIRSICSFGEDGRGELYVLDLSGGEVFKIVPNFMDLQVPTLVAGSGATITLAGATPNSPVYLAYSATGLALTDIPQLGVNIVLRNPRLAATRTSSGAGAASFNVNVPAGAFGRNVWIQAAEIDNVSNLAIVTIQ
jgi:hypothetical protein